MATKTTQKNGNWSDPTVWNDGTLPTSGQTIQISHNVIYDVDTSGFAAGHGAISIDAGKSITASTTAGAYYMKMAGSITAAAGVVVTGPTGAMTLTLNKDGVASAVLTWAPSGTTATSSGLPVSLTGGETMTAVLATSAGGADLTANFRGVLS